MEAAGFELELCNGKLLFGAVAMEPQDPLIISVIFWQELGGKNWGCSKVTATGFAVEFNGGLGLRVNTFD